MKAGAVTTNEDFEYNKSNEVPKHRHKRLFMLQSYYISESEGPPLSNAYRDLEPSNRRQCVKSIAIRTTQEAQGDKI